MCLEAVLEVLLVDAALWSSDGRVSAVSEVAKEEEAP